jgi:hypothetical protein
MAKLVALFLVLGITACNPFEKDVSGVWFYVPVTERAKNDTLLTPASFLHLESNGSYTSDFGRYDQGQWRMEADALELTSSKGKTVQLRIQSHERRTLKLFANENTVVTLAKYPGASGDQNPFAIENNLWRIPATHPESDTELRARLHNHCRFWEKYFSWALENDVDALDVRNTPTPITIYGNGFGLHKYEELPAAWRQYFYDAADCRKALQILQAIFRKRNIKWPETEVTYEKFVSAFQQLQTQLK